MFDCSYIPYRQTHKFTKTVLDYIDRANELKPFYEHEVSLQGIQAAINQRKAYATNRVLLVEQLTKQYENVSDSELVRSNIAKLKNRNTFTICTAHQPNIFTGHLYFIYKILHVIKLADQCKKDLPEYDFVPVFFMGSEDADLEELNHIVIDGKKYTWETDQKGAVGRMKIDANFLRLIDEIEGTLYNEPYGAELLALVKRCYEAEATIEHATFLFVHELFKEFGLIVFLPDAAAWKKPMISVFEDDLINHTAGTIAGKTSEKLSEHYKAQAFPREINLFYLKDNIRNRIEQVGDKFAVHETDLVFTKEELIQELREHPERFSPNVILRGLFQETILPNVAFVGGGGELAYWLQLREVFRHYQTPFPVLILRNSFVIVQKKWEALLLKLGLHVSDLFDDEQHVFDDYVKKHSQNPWALEEEKLRTKELYLDIKDKANPIDSGLQRHIEALEKRTLNHLGALEKKLFRAQKKKFEAAERQLDKLYIHLFPANGLQERTENFMGFYALWGPAFIRELYHASLTLQQEFAICRER